MSEPMFVISEDEMKNIIDLTEEMCETPGWVINVQPIANRRMDITNKIRSRTLSDEVERAYRHGFNDGQAEGWKRRWQLIQHEPMNPHALKVKKEPVEVDLGKELLDKFFPQDEV